MPIIWQANMSVGNTIIDDEHKYLFCLINSVEIALKLENNRSILKMLIFQLEQYTREHFSQEEKIQVKIKYSGYAEHKMEHQRILDNIAELKQSLFDQDEPTTQATPATEDAPETEPTISDDEALQVDDYDPGTEDSPEADSEAEAEASPEPTQPPLNALPQEEIVKLLRTWILEHVLQTDMKMKRILGRYPKNFA